jgi:DNA-binding GntR family transcriptional regulator
LQLRKQLQKINADGTTADAVYDVLRQSIVDGELKPGLRLRSDALATEMRVSRTPVREALRKLEAEGLVTRSGRTGVVVRALTEQDLTELFYVREALEGMSARLAALNATPAEIAAIGELLEDMDQVGRRGDVKALRRLTGEFHRLICHASHNTRLLQSLDVLLDQVRQSPSTTLGLVGRPLEAIEEHRRLLRAIEARDSDRAEALAREHRRKTLELRKEMLREQLRKSRTEGGESPVSHLDSK